MKKFNDEKNLNVTAIKSFLYYFQNLLPLGGIVNVVKTTL
jgi:hypothetical protein